MANVLGCHLVGSVPLPDTATSLRQCTAGMPNRLKRITDGETGVRNMFTFFQSFAFQASPAIMTRFVNNAPIERNNYTPEEIDEGVETLKKAGPIQTGYDDAAIESYSVFKKLKEEGTIAKDTRLQVAIPTPPNVLAPFVQFAFQPRIEPIYQEAVYRAMRNMQDRIPHDQLAIQIDLAVDTAYWEGVDLYKPWFGEGDIEKIKDYIIDYVVRMIGQIDQDVEVGIHNCYEEGDMEHQHWFEPPSLAKVVERGLRIYENTPHKIGFFHVPVARSALDNIDAYLAPLKDLLPKFREHGTDLYLGVIHYNDMAATKKMIDAASKVLDDFPFGVATECGWGRTPPEQIEEIMRMSTEVSKAVL